MEKPEKSLFRRFLKNMDLPEEVDLNVPKFTMIGNTDLMVENHRGILKYDDTQVRFMTSQGTVKIEGKVLEMTEFGSERIMISGRIQTLLFEDGIQCGNL